MICTGIDSETQETIQLDDYVDYLLDDIEDSINVTMIVETPQDNKMEYLDGAQKKQRKIDNAKHAERRRRTPQVNH